MYRHLAGHLINNLPIFPHHQPNARQLSALRLSAKQLRSTKLSMSTASMWHRRLDVGDFPSKTDVWGLDPPNNTAPSLQILVIPGNPGLGSYYLPFMSALQQHLDVPATIRTLSHAGQDTHSASSGYSLQDQVQHKVAFLRTHMQLGPDAPPLIIAGHSIGAYMAVHAVRIIEEAIDQNNIACVAALFPFFAVDPTSFTQRRLRWLVARPGLAGALVSAAACLPLFLRRALVGTYGGAWWYSKLWSHHAL